jgi:cytochrome c
MQRRIPLIGLLAGLACAVPTYAADLSDGDTARGAEVYGRCLACHSFERNRTGPLHCGLFGRKAGGVIGYSYSRAMKESGIVWNSETLDRFLRAPLEVVPGTKMGYAGVKNSKDRAALIAYMAATANDPSVCK